MMKNIFGLVALTLAASFAQAQNDAGCGLGSLIIQDNTKLMQVLAATTNAVGVQTFAITTGTSNCTAQNFVMREKAVRYFAEVNQQDLTREMAQGRGEKLTTLASLYGCEGQAQQDFARMTQTSFDRIVTSDQLSADELVTNLSARLHQETQLAQSCQIRM